ncbi:MAG: flavin reductase [Candidatus Marinimicrobia bacterium]|nr:flavin reductase [Candidatus Neomarinimicrobiota bacterium]
MADEKSNEVLKLLFKKFNYGLYVLGAAFEEEFDMITCSWVMQTSFTLGGIVINIEKDRPVYSLIRKKNRFTISILGKENLDEATLCALTEEKRLKVIDSLEMERTDDGIPYLKNSIGYMNCEYSDSFELENSLLLVGNPFDGLILSDGELLTLHDYYKLSG